MKEVYTFEQVLMQSADDEEREKMIESTYSKCEGDAVVEVKTEDIGNENVKKLLLGLALIAIGKMAYEE